MKSKRYWLIVIAILCAAGFFAAQRPDSVDAPVKEAASLRLEVDLSERQLSVIENGEVTETYPVAIGKPSYPTPKGSFSIRRIIWNPRWVPPDSPWAKKKRPKAPGEEGNPMGKVKIFFSEPDYYIHGTKEVDSLGQAESHGCLRMANPDVVSLAKKVMDAGGKPVTQSYEITTLRNYEITKLRNYEITKLRNYEITTLRNWKVPTSDSFELRPLR
jgi:murein L,D-transpeptidase YcbB/YkuD